MDNIDMTINKELRDLLKGFVAGEMTATAATAEVFDAVMEYDENSNEEACFDIWEPFADYPLEEVACMMSSMECSAERLLRDSLSLISEYDLKAEMFRRNAVNSQNYLSAIKAA